VLPVPVQAPTRNTASLQLGLLNSIGLSCRINSLSFTCKRLRPVLGPAHQPGLFSEERQPRCLKIFATKAALSLALLLMLFQGLSLVCFLSNGALCNCQRGPGQALKGLS